MSEAPRPIDEERILRESAASPEDPMSPMSATLEQEALPEEEGAIKAGRLAGKTMRQAIWILAWPVLLQQTMAAGVGFVDKLVAGNMPADAARAAMDGVGIGSFVGWFIGRCRAYFKSTLVRIASTI